MIENPAPVRRSSTLPRNLALGFSAGFLAVLTYFILANWTTLPVHRMFSEPLYLYSVWIYVLSSLFALVVIIRTRAFSPSIVLFVQFLVIPLVGIIGYEAFTKGYGHGLGIDDAFPHATLIWALGAAAFAAGVAFYHTIAPLRESKNYWRWNPKRAKILVFLSFGIGLIFTAVSVVKIGHIPVLQGGIDAERGSYLNIIGIGGLSGTNVLRLSSLGMVAGTIAWMLVVQGVGKKVYLPIVLASCLLLTWTGYRSRSAFLITAGVLYVCKFWRSAKKMHIVVGVGILLCLLFGYLLYPHVRAETKSRNLNSIEIASSNLYPEWRAYSQIVREVESTGRYYEERLFLGQLVPVLPKQVWAIFGIDKDYFIEHYTGAHVFGRQMDHALGIRIGPIGEAYAGYAIEGVLLHMFLYGVLIGCLEKIYLQLDKRDARQSIVCFLIALALHLPFTSLYFSLSNIVSIVPVFVLFLILGAHRSPRAWVPERYD